MNIRSIIPDSRSFQSVKELDYPFDKYVDKGLKELNKSITPVKPAKRYGKGDDNSETETETESDYSDTESEESENNSDVSEKPEETVYVPRSLKSNMYPNLNEEREVSESRSKKNKKNKKNQDKPKHKKKHHNSPTLPPLNPCYKKTHETETNDGFLYKSNSSMYYTDNKSLDDYLNENIRINKIGEVFVKVPIMLTWNYTLNTLNPTNRTKIIDFYETKKQFVQKFISKKCGRSLNPELVEKLIKDTEIIVKNATYLKSKSNSPVNMHVRTNLFTCKTIFNGVPVELPVPTSNDFTVHNIELNSEQSESWVNKDLDSLSKLLKDITPQKIEQLLKSTNGDIKITKKLPIDKKNQKKMLGEYEEHVTYAEYHKDCAFSKALLSGTIKKVEGNKNNYDKDGYYMMNFDEFETCLDKMYQRRNALPICNQITFHLCCLEDMSKLDEECVYGSGVIFNGQVDESMLEHKKSEGCTTTINLMLEMRLLKSSIMDEAH